MLEIELNASALPDDHQVYKCFPGEGYKFYDVVLAESTVFLDIRGLDELPENPATWDDAALRNTIALDRAMRGTRRRLRGRKHRKSAIEQRNFNFVKGLLLGLRRGALVIVPPPGYRRDVLIGEVIDEPGRPRRVEARDGDVSFTYLGRKVRWLASVEKRLLKRDLLDKLHTAQAFFPVGESLHEDAYELAYENYVWRGNFVSTFRTSKEHFTSSDNLLSSIWFNGLAAAASGADLGTKSFVETALLPDTEKAQNELELNINSPGTILLRSVGAFALASMALLPLSVSEAQQVANGQARITLRAVNGSDPNCQIQVEAAVADYIRSLGPQRLLDMCEYGKKARDEATLKANVRLKNTTRGRS